jgi:Cytochrome c
MFTAVFSSKKKDSVLRTLQRFATVCFIGAAAAALITACSSTDAAPPPTGGAGAAQAVAGAAGAHAAGAGNTAGAGGSSAGAPATLIGDPTRGATAFKMTSAACDSCHGTMGEGSSGPNISGSTTAGIGMWSQTQFHDAVRLGKNRTGGMLCNLMAPATVANVSDQAIADIFAWLQSIKGQDTKVIGAFCAAGCTCTGT